MQSNMVLGYKELKFNGLKFVEDKKKYPWKNDKEADKVFEDLVEEGSEYSKIRYKKLMQLQYDEDIHVKLTYTMVLEYLSYGLMGLTFLLIFSKLVVPSLVSVLFSVGCYLLNKYLNRKVAELYMFKEVNSSMVDILFSKEELTLDLK